MLQNGGGAAQTLYCPVFNDHRFFASYAWIYRTCLIFIPTLFTPLTYLGYNVYRMNWMLKRRSKMENRPKWLKTVKNTSFLKVSCPKNNEGGWLLGYLEKSTS